MYKIEFILIFIQMDYLWMPVTNKRIISGVRGFGKLWPKIKRKWLARQNNTDDFSLIQVAIHSVAIISPIQ